ncbi:ABC transporter substrate-binding protein [Pseudemcibacter aquimaris]|uniref:ABC transporter substrate-binding protein n=1 Tax=Pseudemcibacter aquimaris TaxID=2857064 RepID=UPI0020129B61|nr:ABC transporter substrate-binding protein [Pseudemcibacter aquimaris]MCC3861524.1 ABC transporter substrate-binding protein [Pseudemcibacter aquimaris]WDU58293.1 ABC transporter substrate-binding protein [Pseudemcibacter aquimaris]
MKAGILKYFLMTAFMILMSGVSHADRPRAVSIDFCADQYLLALASNDQIVSISKQSLEPHSYYRDRAKTLPNFDGTLEQILTLKNTHIMATEGAYNVLPALINYGIETIRTSYGHRPEVVYENIENFAKFLNQEERGQTLIKERQTILAKLQSLPSKNKTILYLTPSGYTAGTSTYVDDVIKMAGYKSYAETHGITSWQPLSLERVILNPPDLIITSFFDNKNVHVSHWSLTRHPKIVELMDHIPTIPVPGQLSACGGLFSIEAADYIRNQADDLLKHEEIK